MDKITKFLAKLNKKQRAQFVKLFSDIKNQNLSTYDVKHLTGELKGYSRIRLGKIRVIYFTENNTGYIVDIGFRKDIYN
jgi:mRNA-degrading endonuclease RelE of RelBE toxin-antitoxin system